MAVLFSQSSSFYRFILCAQLCVLFLFLLAPRAEAAVLSIRPASDAYELGEQFKVAVELDPEGAPVSHVDVNLKFDTSVLFVIGINEEASVIDDWESEPSFSNSEGIVTLAGTSTKGIRANSTILQIDFRVIGYGKPSVSFLHVILTTADGDQMDVGADSRSSSYTITLNEPRVYTTVTTVSTTEFWPGFFSEAVMLNLGLLIVLLVFLGHLAYVHRQFKMRELRLRRETVEIHEQLTKIFSALRDEIYDQIRSITKRSKLSKNEAGAVAGLNQALEVSETLISKEINDVKNLLD